MNQQQLVFEQLYRIMRNLHRGAGEMIYGDRLPRILTPIAKREGISTRELAEILDIRPSSLNEILARLEHGGLIRRSRDPRDQRVFLLHLTQQGQEQLERSRAALARSNEILEQILSTDEWDTLEKLCRKLADGLDANVTKNRPHRPHHAHKKERRE